MASNAHPRRAGNLVLRLIGTSRRALARLALLLLVPATLAGSAPYAASAFLVGATPLATALGSETITFAALAGKTFAAAPFAVSATASSGLAVSFTTTTPAFCTISGATVTIVGAGTCTIRASQSGNATYAAATSVDQSFIVAKAAQTIAFAALGGKTYGTAAFTVSATTTSGLAVTFSSTTTAVCTVSGTTVTLVAAGTCTLQAAQVGNANYNAATNVSQSFAIAKAAQTIMFAALGAKTYGAAPFAVSATASSGLAVKFASTTTAVCTVSVATVTIVAGGTCTIQAAQAGNGNYNAATSVSQSFAVAKAAQTITFAALGAKTYGAAPFAVGAIASSGLAVAFASTTTAVCTVSIATVTIVAGGTCTIQASQAGNGNYNAAANVNQSFAVAKAAQTITFAALSGKTIGAAPFAVSATASSGLAVTFVSTTTAVCTVSAGNVTLVAAGTCTIQAQQAGTAAYAAATNVNQSFTVSKVAQTIAFAALAGRTMGAAPFTVSATASSGLAVSFTSTTTPVCTASGATVSLVSAGTCTLRAAQAGNATYAAAPNVSQGFTVAVAVQSQTITFPPPAEQVLGTGPVALSATASSGLPVTLTTQTASICSLTGSSVTLLDAGLCTIQAAQAGNASYTAAPSVGRTFRVILPAQFGSSMAYAVGSYPWGIATGDINNDGKLDIVVGNLGDGTVSVYLGTGDGSFTLASTTAFAQGFPQPVALGDFNGDGKLDLVVGNVSDGTLTYFPGNGNGSFGTPQLLTVGGQPFALAVADLNRDGKLDLVVTIGSFDTTQAQSIAVLLGNGDGSFQPAVAYATDATPMGIVLADFNGDGLLDVAVACYGSNSVSVLLGNGNGTFGAAASFATNWNPRTVAAADFNGDGRLDLAVVNVGSNSVSILFGNGDGSFAAASDLWAGSGAQFLALGDFNGDGKTDVVVTNALDNDFVLLLGVGDGTFHAAQTFVTGTYPAGVVVGDFNRDGKPDLAVVNYLDNTFAVLLNSASFTPVSTLALQSGTPQSAAVNTAYATPFAVMARDGASNPIPGAVLTFTAPAVGASGQFGAGGAIALATTGANGVATAPTFTANAIGGGFSVVAIAGNATATFALTNTGGTTQAPLFTSAPPPGGAVNTSYSYLLTASGAPAPTFAAPGNPLPTGLGLNATSGLISGTPNAAGTYAGMLTASNGIAPNATQTFAITISGVAQTIAFGSLGSVAYGTVPFAVNATASSGLAVSFSSVTTPVCAVSGNTVTIVAAGTCTLQAAQAGNAVYSPAANVSRSFAVAQATQTITFTALASRNLGSAPFTVSATASSGLAVGFSSLTPSVCSVSGSTVTLVAAGTCTLQASQAGNANIAAAPSVQQSLTVGLAGVAPGFINATPITGTVNAAYSYQVSASGTPAPGFSVGTNPLPPGVTLNNASGLISGTPAAKGTFAGTLTASNGVNPDAVQPFAITIAGLSQTITFGALANMAPGAAPFSVNATASSGLPVTFNSASLSVCTVSGNTVTLVGTGACFITAQQAGNAIYAPAPGVGQYFNVVLGTSPQSITFGRPPDQNFGTTPITVSAFATSYRPVSFASMTPAICTVSGSTVTLVAVGTCRIEASQAGDTIYAAAAPVDQSFTVRPALSIALLEPLEGSYFDTSTSIEIVAATDLYASVSRIELYRGATLLASRQQPSIDSNGGSRSNAFLYTWSGVPVGTYTLTAVAVDINGTRTTSAGVSVNVTPYKPPLVSILSPADYAGYSTPVNVGLSSSARSLNPGGTITKVEYYAGTALIGTATVAPYTVSWINAAPGAYSLAARAYDSFGTATTSEPIDVTVTAGSQAIKFVHMPDYPDAGPVVAVADFNGDGHPDIATDRQFLVGDGSGNFAVGAPYPKSSGRGAAGSIVATDFDGDHKIDLAFGVVNGIWIALGNGDGTFKPEVFHAAGNGTAPPLLALTVADFNGDGHPDLAAVNASNNAVVVLVGSGNGTFLPAVSYPTGSAPMDLAVGDFNGDGKLDLVVANATDNSISILRGNGDGTFQPGVRIVTGSFPSAPTGVAVGDFNGDGKLDVAVTNDVVPTVSVLLGKGDGSFQPVIDYPAGSDPNAIAVADLNGDGKLDIAVTNSTTVSILLGNGDGTFRLPVAFGVPGPAGIVVTDVNGDGQPDLVIGGSGGHSPDFLDVWFVHPSRHPAPVSVLFNATHSAVVAPTFTSGPPPAGIATSPYTFSFTASGTPAPSFSIDSAFELSTRDSTHRGLKFARNGILSGDIGPGTYTGTVIAGNGAAPNAAQAFTIQIRQADQTINFPPVVDQPLHPLCTLCPAIVIPATASSGLSVAFTSLSPSVCTITASGTLTVVSAGSCVIRAAQPGNNDYAPAPSVDRTFNITPDPSAPVVALTAPTSGAQFVAPATITLNATATSAGRTIAKVEYFANGALVGTRIGTPYSIVWSNVPSRTWSITARATDSTGATTTSSAITLTVNPPANQSPAVTLTLPTAGQSFAAGVPVNLAATANDPDGTIAKVEFFDSASLIATTTAAPYAASWIGAPVGPHTVTARATDNKGAVTTSAAVAIAVTANALPTVTLTLPRNGETFSAGSAITLVASAADADGGIAKVEFVASGVVVGTVTTAPFRATWLNVPAGRYTVLARATDNRGAIVASATASIQVVTLALAITSPSNGVTLPADFVLVTGTYQAPANSGVTINGTVARNDGQGHFFANSLPLDDGANTISVTLTTPDGQTMTQAQTVTRTGMAPMEVYVEANSAFVPASFTVHIRNRTANAIVNVAYPNLGSGQLDTSFVDAETLGTIIYATPGIYQPGFVITDSAGNVYTQYLGLLARDNVALDRMLTAQWNRFTAALAAGDKNSALDGLSPPARIKYGPVFDVLMQRMPEIIAGWSVPQTSLLSDAVAEYAINRMIDGVNRLFLIYLLQDANGIWKIDEM